MVEFNFTRTRSASLGLTCTRTLDAHRAPHFFLVRIISSMTEPDTSPRHDSGPLRDALLPFANGSICQIKNPYEGGLKCKEADAAGSSIVVRHKKNHGGGGGGDGEGGPPLRLHSLHRGAERGAAQGDPPPGRGVLRTTSTTTTPRRTGSRSARAPSRDLLLCPGPASAPPSPGSPRRSDQLRADRHHLLRPILGALSEPGATVVRGGGGGGGVHRYPPQFFRFEVVQVRPARVRGPRSRALAWDGTEFGGRDRVGVFLDRFDEHSRHREPRALPPRHLLPRAPEGQGGHRRAGAQVLLPWGASIMDPTRAPSMVEESKQNNRGDRSELKSLGRLSRRALDAVKDDDKHMDKPSLRRRKLLIRAAGAGPNKGQRSREADKSYSARGRSSTTRVSSSWPPSAPTPSTRPWSCTIRR
ncbi:hypothetical protein GGTG_12203 [Gaeumannomyces tritici R3-111a-1]|uniref:Uncharacterized protein n=1 Tax=Gaeumannomyces tritici (strain R3-111a-1) TaxID=644352 RepID=J3PFC6_GAET3|nr:hypothetical protein GGTG_12203 [Gaeumannomyces tritici R3-111a-1]EJT70028.1 hypothetical protein GGTG_12203 [Gaeumannomyces tritici R3-111a-1]